jgi:hypothetical protein
MLLRQLEYLVALAMEGHFARAAAACFVSQPSLSAAIRRLEHELDVPIVRRGIRSAQACYAAGTREILESWLDGIPIRDEYLIVDGGAPAGTGAHSYSVTH